MATRATGQRRAKAPAARRAEILQAALGLFHRRGFDETTVQHIADAAGVAAGTVYLYFPSKEHILLVLHEDCHHELEHHIQRLAEARLGEGTEDLDYRETIDVLLDAMVGYLSTHRVEMEVISRYIPRVRAEAEEQEIASAQFLAGLIELGLAAGRVHVSDPEMAARLLLAAVGEPLVKAVVAGDDTQVQRLVAQAKELFHKALAPVSRD